MFPEFKQTSMKKANPTKTLMYGAHNAIHTPVIDIIHCSSKTNRVIRFPQRLKERNNCLLLIQ